MSFPFSKNEFINFFVLIVCCGFFCQTAAAQKSGKRTIVSEVGFKSGNSTRNIPFELHNNHIYLQVKVNNSELLSFILDTGASSLINREIAESLGLEFRGKEKGFGIGENAVEASIVKGVSLTLSGAILSKQNIAVVSLKDLQKSLGRKVDGILGYSFLSRFVIEIDYAAKTIILHAPKSYQYKGKGEFVPLIVDAESGLIFARATLKPTNRPPIKGLFEIDSGGGHALILNSPFVEQNNFLSADQKANAVSVGGIVGSSRAVAGTVENLQVGRRSRLDNVNTLFSLASEGMLANEEFHGNIGNDFLRHFKVVFDYSRRLMILESAK